MAKLTMNTTSNDDLDSLLCEAMEGSDERRLALVLAICLCQPDWDREIKGSRSDCVALAAATGK